MEEREALLTWLEKHAKIWLRLWLENGRLRKLSNEREVHKKVCQRFLALVLTRVHDKIIQAKSLEYKQQGREGIYFTVCKYHPTGEIEIQCYQVPINKLKSRDRTPGNQELVRWWNDEEYFQLGIHLLLSSPQETTKVLEKKVNIVEHKQNSVRVRTDPRDFIRCLDLVQSYWEVTPVVIL